MSKKIILGISLFMFSTGALDLQGSWLSDKMQRVKNSVKNPTFKGTLNCSAKVAVIAACLGVLIGVWRFIKNYEAQTKQLQKLNDETIPSLHKTVENQTRTVAQLNGIPQLLVRQELLLRFISDKLVVIPKSINTDGEAKPEGNVKGDNK